MMGAAGALCCLAAGTAAGVCLRERRLARLHMLRAYGDMLGGMRTALEQEQPAVPQLLLTGADYAMAGTGAEEARQRFRQTAHRLVQQPLSGLEEAYAAACAQTAAPWERPEEKAAMEALMRQLGCGTAAMREQALAACIRRLKPLEEAAQKDAETGGRLCLQLGALLGLMAGIALW